MAKKKTIEQFQKDIKGSMEELFGNCREYKDVLRSVPEHLGVMDASAIFEVALEAGLNPDAPYPILHFHTTLAQNIDDSILPGILMGLNDLNTTISAGAFPAFGCFGYYGPLKQIYLSYRMPANPDALDAELENARFYLGSLYEQLDLFTDYILFLCDDPNKMSLQDYMDYLDSIADLNDLEARLDDLEKRIDSISASDPSKRQEK